MYRLVIFAAFMALVAHAEIKLSAIFSDHMVLQRGNVAPVWGWAAPGRPVTVEVGPHSARTRTNAEGRWRLTLPPLESGK